MSGIMLALSICCVWIFYFDFMVLVGFFFFFFKIAYKIAREGFSGRLKETFLVLSDDEPRPASSQVGASGLDRSRLQDPRRGQKHQLNDDAMSVESGAAKKQDQTRSNEKNKSKGRNK